MILFDKISEIIFQDVLDCVRFYIDLVFMYNLFFWISSG